MVKLIQEMPVPRLDPSPSLIMSNHVCYASAVCWCQKATRHIEWANRCSSCLTQIFFYDGSRALMLRWQLSSNPLPAPPPTAPALLRSSEHVSQGDRRQLGNVAAYQPGRPKRWKRLHAAGLADKLSGPAGQWEFAGRQAGWGSRRRPQHSPRKRKDQKAGDDSRRGQGQAGDPSARSAGGQRSSGHLAPRGTEDLLSCGH